MTQLNIILCLANAELVKKLEESEKARMDKVLEESDTSKVSQFSIADPDSDPDGPHFCGVDWIRVRNNQSSVSRLK
jgi:hypothetical protein